MSDRRAFGEFLPLECWRGELADVLVSMPGVIVDTADPFPLVFACVVLWAEQSSQPATCDLFEHANTIGVVVSWSAWDDATYNGITTLIAPDGVGLWLRALARE